MMARKMGIARERKRERERMAFFSFDKRGGIKLFIARVHDGIERDEIKEGRAHNFLV